MSISGIHHITVISSDAVQTTNFYTHILGLHLVKKTVNFIPPHNLRLYFGDEAGKPGSLVSFIESPGTERGHPGIGGTHHFAFIVETPEAQLKWKRRLTDLGTPVIGPYNRVYFNSIYFRDPDGTILEIATRNPGFAIDEPLGRLGQEVRPPPLEYRDGNRDEEEIAARTWSDPVPAIEPDMRLPGLHHITVVGSDIQRTTEFYVEKLGLQLVKRTMNFDDPNSPHYYYGLNFGKPGTIITYFERDPRRERPVRSGAGQTHHFALRVDSEDDLAGLRQGLLSAGVRVSEAIDFKYYKGIQFEDPFGHIIEVATSGPGLTMDEQRSELGSRLMLPDWLEPDRQQIEANLVPLSTPVQAST